MSSSNSEITELDYDLLNNGWVRDRTTLDFSTASVAVQEIVLEGKRLSNYPFIIKILDSIYKLLLAFLALDDPLASLHKPLRNVLAINADLSQ